MPKAKDLTGQTFGYLKVIAPGQGRIRESGRKVRTVLCRCACGTEKEISVEHLLRKKKPTRSCGCRASVLDAVGHTTHGMADSSLYSVWNEMRQRCTNPHDPSWPRYGGRGIEVCPRWRDSFDAFLADMGATYHPGLQLDRKDNDGAYCPENCRWATRSENGRNKRNNRLVTACGETVTVAELAERAKVNYGTMWSRVKRGNPLLSEKEEARFRSTTC